MLKCSNGSTWFETHWKSPFGNHGNNPRVYEQSYDCYVSKEKSQPGLLCVHMPLTPHHPHTLPLSAYQIVGHVTSTVKYISHQHTAGSAFWVQTCSHVFRRPSDSCSANSELLTHTTGRWGDSSSFGSLLITTPPIFCPEPCPWGQKKMTPWGEGEGLFPLACYRI